LAESQGYELVFKPSVERDLRQLPAASRARVLARIEELAREPLPPGVVKLTGAERLYRIRIGDYRVIYELSRVARQVIIHYVRHRRDAYRSR
jgi:mRNA interferase RelE/StbE